MQSIASLSILRNGISCYAAGRMVSKIGTRTMSTVYNLSDEEAVEKFQKINDKSILYFTATWCPPCKMIKPVYESMAKQYPEIAFGKVDVDDNSESASTYEITGVPTFILFQQDKVYKRFTGADQSQLEQSLASLKSTNA
mmetsp:Transcript_2729/g.5098  ORF Transcript_2729/g.5098 Transcript_2729/m.5098 type:complete len:140 (+) Transcript_2729:178-597(+)